MSTKVVPLCLEQVGWQVSGPVAVVEAEGCTERGCRDPPQSPLAHDVPPTILGVVDSLVEEIVEQEVLQVGILPIRLGDVFEEHGADDATATPHQSDGGLVQLPPVFFSRLTQRRSAGQ